MAQSTFPSQKVQSTLGSDHFWKVRCSKSARRCVAQHIPKSRVEQMAFSGHFSRLGCGSAWQAQGILHVVKSESNVKVL